MRSLNTLPLLLSASCATATFNYSSVDFFSQQPIEASASRTYFYIGGHYVNATLPGGNTTGQYMTGQIYVEKLTPPLVTQQSPVLFVAGRSQTGANFLNTPDNREGWASLFLRQGHVVYLTDQAQRGRSPWLPGDGDFTDFSVYTMTSVFSAPQDVRPLPYPQAYLHTQWPGSGQLGDPIFDAFYASQVPSVANVTRLAEYNNISYNALLEHIAKPVILVSHSQSGPFGFQMADSRPGLVRAHIALEPQGPPFSDWTGHPFAPGYQAPGGPRPFGVTQLAVNYEPSIDGDAAKIEKVIVPAANANVSSCMRQEEPARKLINMAKVPTLLLTGEGSLHRVYDECTVAYLRQAGVNVDHVQMGDVGVHGNGHFAFVEKNNQEVLEKIVWPWLEKKSRGSDLSCQPTR